MPGAVAAQPVAGLGEDAIPIQPGGARFVIGALWDQWDRQLVPGGGRSALLDGFGTSSLGAAQLPGLAEAEHSIRTLTGLDSYSLTLGALEARGAVRRASTTFQGEFGITRRLSLSVRVPYVEVVHDAQLVLNRMGTGANVGANPRSVDNGIIAFQINASREALLNEIAACSNGGSSPACDEIRADPDAANALVSRAEEFRLAWDALYGEGGTSENLGAPVVPVALSDADLAIAAALTTLRTQFERYFSTDIPSSAQRGAVDVFGTNDLQSIAQDSAFGLGADTLDRSFRAGMGDVDLEARFILLDSWGGDQAARLSTTTSGVRLLASAGWRFGTASSPQANEPFALATGEGVNALLLRLTADAVWKQRAWISATIRTTTPMSDDAVLRLPGVGSPATFFASRPIAVSRTLGQRIAIEVAPRLNVTDKIGLSASWQLRSAASDRFSPASGEAFEMPSGTAQFGAIGVTFSTLAPYVRGKSKWPLEVMFAHEVALGASGRATPSLVRDRLELRIYPGFPGR